MKHRILDSIERAARRAGLLIAPAWRTTQIDEEHHMRRLLAHLRVDCVFDVGANVGQYAEKLRRQFEFRGLILSFEPNPAAWDKLKAASDMDPQWEIFPFALGAEPGTAEFQAYEDSKLGSLLEFDPSSPHAPTGMARLTIPVEVKTLAEILPAMRGKYSVSRPFLKLDTQGFDLQVAKGAGDRLTEFLGIQSEVSFSPIYAKSPLFAEVVKYYEDQGFVLSRLFPNNDVHFPRMVEMDVAMIRADQTGVA